MSRHWLPVRLVGTLDLQQVAQFGKVVDLRSWSITGGGRETPGAGDLEVLETSPIPVQSLLHPSQFSVTNCILLWSTRCPLPWCAIPSNWPMLLFCRVFAHSKERSILVEHSFLFPPCPSLLVPYPLSKPCSKRLMKQNKEVKAGKLFNRGRRLNLCRHCVTEQNSYLKLFPQLWMGPECHCYQSHTLKKTADNMPGKIGSLSLENVWHFHPLTLLSLSISDCHKSLLADKLCWYKPAASGGTRETCHSHSGRDCQLCSSQADCTGCWLRERGREIAISQ